MRAGLDTDEGAQDKPAREHGAGGEARVTSETSKAASLPSGPRCLPQGHCEHWVVNTGQRARKARLLFFLNRWA